MTPPALLGEVWRTVLDGRDVVIVRHDVPHAVEWRDGEWHRMWDEDAAAIFRAWGEAMAAERDAARGVAQLAVEERAAAGRIALAADIRSLRAGAAAWMQRRLVDAYRDERDRMRVERDALRKQLARAQDELDAYRDAHRGRATP